MGSMKGWNGEGGDIEYQDRGGTGGHEGEGDNTEISHMVITHLTGLSPNMAPLYCRAMGTDSGLANSTNTNLKQEKQQHLILLTTQQEFLGPNTTPSLGERGEPKLSYCPYKFDSK